MEQHLLIWFCNPILGNGDPEALSEHYWFTEDLVANMSIDVPQLTGQEKTISLRLKNPLNFMTDYRTLINGQPTVRLASNPMGQKIVSDWDNVVVNDAKFLVFKGTMDDWVRMGSFSDADERRTKATLGIFYVEKVTSNTTEQTVDITGRDAMGLASRWAIWKDPLKFPPTGYDNASHEIYVGQIIHTMFHIMGCWHNHKDGTIHQTKWNGNLAASIPDVNEHYSTNMTFHTNLDHWEDEQICENKIVTDFWNVLLQYTGYKIYVSDRIVSGVPISVFMFEPPAYKMYSMGMKDEADNTLSLFGSYVEGGVTHNVDVINSIFLPPTTTHYNPITITDISLLQDGSIPRRAIKVTTKGSNPVVIDDPGFIGAQRLRDAESKVGVVVELTIDAKYATNIGISILYQLRELYSVFSMTFSDAVKFRNRLYNFNIDTTNKGIYIVVNGLMQCTKNNISWNGTRYMTTASFTPTNILLGAITVAAEKMEFVAGTNRVALAWQGYDAFEEGSTVTYQIKRWHFDGDSRIEDGVFETTDTFYLDTGLTNGTQYHYACRTIVTGGSWNGISAWSAEICVTPTAEAEAGSDGYIEKPDKVVLPGKVVYFP